MTQTNKPATKKTTKQVSRNSSETNNSEKTPASDTTAPVQPGRVKLGMRIWMQEDDAPAFVLEEETVKSFLLHEQQLHSAESNVQKILEEQLTSMMQGIKIFINNRLEKIANDRNQQFKQDSKALPHGGQPSKAQPLGDDSDVGDFPQGVPGGDSQDD